MKISRERAMRAATLLGMLHDDDLEQTVAAATRELRWWQVVWMVVTSPRYVWIGVKDALRNR